MQPLVFVNSHEIGWKNLEKAAQMFLSLLDSLFPDDVPLELRPENPELIHLWGLLTSGLSLNAYY